jgi:hypothetical protein
MAAIVFVLTRWLRRVLGGGEKVSRKPSGKLWWDDDSRHQSDKPKLKTLTFRRPPHVVLGVEKGAALEQIEEARARLLAENSPELVDSMSDEIQEVARRKTEEIEAAYAALVEDVH